MVLKRDLRQLLDETDVAFRECWATLLQIKNKENRPLVNYQRRLLDFQPALASALFRLDAFYRRVKSDERSLIARKQELSPSWFRRRMRTLAHYRDAVNTAIEIGHGLGDSFAWLFYARDRRSLRAHLKVPRQKHLPPGIGGRGELEFLRQVKKVGNHLAIYHGTTSFLRIGDISLFDMGDGHLVGIGELKTTQIKPGQLELTLHMVTSRSPDLGDTTRPPEHRPAPLLPATQARLQRQMRAMTKTLAPPKRERANVPSQPIHSAAHLEELDSLYRRIGSHRVAYQRAGNGLLLAGVRTGRVRFATRLMEQSRANFGTRLAAAPEEVLKLMDAESPDNAVHLGHLDLRLQLGATPIFWWPVNAELLRELIFGEVVVVTIYNPAHFFRQLRELGFSVEGDRKGGYRVNKVIDGQKVQLHAIDYFLQAIQRNLLTEHAAITAIQQLLQPIGSGEAKPNSRIEMEMLMHWL